MDHGDFVADSDEDEQEQREALALEEEQRTRERSTVNEASTQPVVVQGLTRDDDALGNAVSIEKAEETSADRSTQRDVEDKVLTVGTVVEVDSRTWPGINKLGGPGRITRVSTQAGEQGDAVHVLYDVRYVLGGFERHVASEYVHSSELLHHHSNREKVDRDYYHDDFINKPHERKQREAEARRERKGTRVDEATTRELRTRQRKRPLDRASEQRDRGRARQERQAVSTPERMERDTTPPPTSRTVSSQLSSDRESSVSSDDASTAPSPLLTQRTRRRHHILDSEDESSDESKESPRLEAGTVYDHDSFESQDDEDPPAARHEKTARRQKHRTPKRQRYVGGYEKQGEYADVIFIQPEGNPADLPEDVVRETRLQLASTKKGLMDQLEAIFAQQQKNLAAFHDRQKTVNRHVKGLKDMSVDEMCTLHTQICELRSFVVKTLVHAGEDVMNKIISILHAKRGEPPDALEHFECNFDAWQSKLNECSPWLRNVQNAVEHALARRGKEVSRENDVEAAQFSDSSEADAVDMEMDPTDRWNSEYNEPAIYSFDDEGIQHDALMQRDMQSLRTTKPTALRKKQKSPRTDRPKKWTRNSTLDSYIVRSSASWSWSNLRVVGSQKKKHRLSDSQWNWFEMIRKKHQRGGKGSKTQHVLAARSGTANNMQESRPNLSSRDDSLSVQARRMHLRNKRFRDRASQPRVRELTVAPHATSQHAKSTHMSVRGISQEKTLRSVELTPAPVSSSSVKEQSIDWTSVFEVVSDDPGEDSTVTAVSCQDQVTLLAFGHEIDGSERPSQLQVEEDYDVEATETICDVVIERVARVRQLMHDLRSKEVEWMTSLSSGKLGTAVEDYESAPTWLSLLSLEEAYHSALATLACQWLSTLDRLPLSALPKYVQVVLDQVAALIRHLPDCNALFHGCNSYFFFFEVVSRNAVTTPLLTAIARTFWYCLKLLGALQLHCGRAVQSHTTWKQEIEASWRKTSPKKVLLATVLFLFDLYVYFPSSHRMDRGGTSCSQPALSLWMLVRASCSSSDGLIPPSHESIGTKEKQLWALLQALYQQLLFEELARHFVRNETCGGYYQDHHAVRATDRAHITTPCEETCESKLLALEATWKLVIVLARIFADSDKDETVYDAQWAIVQDLLCPSKHEFLPFQFSPDEWLNLPLVYRELAGAYKQRVLERIALLSKLWLPGKEVLGILLRQLWVEATRRGSNEMVELPQLFKEYITRCKDLGNSRLALRAFVEEFCVGSTDDSTLLCKIIWIQTLKLEKRVHRNRFRRSILCAIPDTTDTDSLSSPHAKAASSHVMLPTQTAATAWHWGRKQPAPIRTVESGAVALRSPNVGAEKERMSIAVLLTFAILGVCLECGDNQVFPRQRSEKDVRYMEREVDFYCKEIGRWTAKKLTCEVLASQALYLLGALLVEKNATEFPPVFQCLNDRLEFAMKNRHSNPPVQTTTRIAASANELDRTSRRYQRATMSSLYQMRDLVKTVVEVPVSRDTVALAYGSAVDQSLEYVLSSGLEACLLGGIRKMVAVNDLKIALEILHVVLPRAADAPRHCFTSEFDELNDDEAFAAFDLEGAIAGHVSRRVSTWTVNECQGKALALLARNLRVAIHQLVLTYPPSKAPTFDELYAVDVLGRLIATCEIPFSWNTMTPASGKPRNLAFRVLSAALKYNFEKEWLCTVFLREPTAVHDLAVAWLLGTLDVRSLNPAPVSFQVGAVPFSLRDARASQASAGSSARYSDSWVILSDEIIYQVLYKVPSCGYSVDAQVLQVLRDVASTCHFQSPRAAKEKLDDEAHLYDLHLDVFQSFCRCVGTKWRSYTLAPAQNWDEMNHFRAKMVHPQLGIFVSFLEAFKLNFRRACSVLDEMNHNWHSFAELFLRQAGVETSEERSYHAMEDSIKLFDARLTGLTTMFRFMYQCIDGFLFHCGDMAIGDTNLFLEAMELLFRQVTSAEHPQAIKRLVDQRSGSQRGSGRYVHDTLRGEFDAATVRFVDSVQLFFARQKYPSLLHWFAQTSEIYQTFKTGWRRSPLRTLLVNMLDPDGPLGIHSYYGVSSDLDSDVKRVRREVFYLACGLFECRQTKAFAHSRAHLAPSASARLRQLRQFVLHEFLRETIESGYHEDGTTLLEMMVPLSQFLRGVVNHANLNRDWSRDDGHEFQLTELLPALEWIIACLIKLVPGETVATSAIGCVLGIEVGGIVCEIITFNESRPVHESMELLELVLSYLHTIHVALVQRTTATMDALFSPMDPPRVQLRAYRFASSAFQDLVVEERGLDEAMDSYGINMARATTDLLALLGRVAYKCQVSSIERLQSFTKMHS
ncbi:hypothetical protein PsorP6_006651 [Peronosclerospora sorghi]|uniref:Uncharacterized protein n=1 Tax=Peronosclerospora sorghi TaxID=230839 RepID=A0ACC0W4Y2_9STRA|nr:hypothetical protein PsorP6_006651 [Peronosclerospora sorghi]